MKLGLNGNWFNKPKQENSGIIQDKPPAPPRKFSAYRTILAHQEEVSARLAKEDKKPRANNLSSSVETDNNPG